MATPATILSRLGVTGATLTGGSSDNYYQIPLLDSNGLLDPSFISGEIGLTSVGLSTNAPWLTVSDSPLTSNGVLNLNLTTGLTANQFLASPNGATGTVDLRSIALTDLPNTLTNLGNTFNGANELLQLNSAGALPVLSGSNLVNLLPSQLTAIAGASYIFVGDSITYGQYLSSPTTECFQAIFATLSFCAGATTRNVGVSGWTIADITSDYTTHVQPHRPTTNGGDGGTQAYLVLMIGINDAFGGSNSATMLSELTTYINLAHTDGFTVVLATILPSSQHPTSYTAQEGYNEAIRAGLIPYNLLWDANSVLTDPTNTAVFSDGIHPTAAAHARLAASLQSALMSQGGSVGAPALYGTDLNSLGNLAIAGNGAIGGTAEASTFASPAGSSYPAMNGLFVGNSASPIYFGYASALPGPAGCTVQDDTNGNLTLEAASTAKLINIGVNRGSQVVIGYGGMAVNSLYITSATPFTAVRFNSDYSAAGESTAIDWWNSAIGYFISRISSFTDTNFGGGLQLWTAPNTGAATTAINTLVIESGSGGMVLQQPGDTLEVKSGTNALAGTVTLSSGAATITSTAIDANTVIVLSLKTSSGTPGTYMPRTSVGSGSATVAGLSTDNSTYNWVAFKVN